ncbi:MAG: hypothetical protein AUK55_06985 [Syntrophobacteraceae bacterium CG2_30_61_12]|nr:MAG: hypothetical protein AUK55_06985 [Syntrophobacteraceae bacterium CG2_30_61_12]
MILLLDRATAQVLDADSEALAWYGLTLEELTARSLFDLHPGMDLTALDRLSGTRMRHRIRLRLPGPAASTAGRPVYGNFHSLEVIGSPRILAVIEEAPGGPEPVGAPSNEQQGLEQRVLERTAELLEANQQLRREIAQRREAEQARRLSEAKYGSLVENSLMGIHINVQGRIVFANQRFAEIHGYSRAELIGMEIHQLVHPDDREMLLGFMACRFQGLKAPREYEARGLTKDGRTIWLMRNATVIDYQGEAAILGNSLDISPRKSMEQSLRESERQLQALSAQLLDAQEQERERIAHELHDGIGQYLTAIKFRLEGACERIRRSTPAVDLTPLRGIVPVIQQAVEEVRRISMDLRPSILSDLGIKATLDWYFRELLAVHPDFTLEREIDVVESQIPEPLKVVIYRLVQEGLHNILKHSGADRVTVRLTHEDKRLRLVIEDNGKGFQLAAVESLAQGGKGFGLAGMRKRAELSGGEFLLESQPACGTRLEAGWQLR